MGELIKRANCRARESLRVENDVCGRKNEFWVRNSSDWTIFVFLVFLNNTLPDVPQDGERG
jgi:hypothetical protein